MVFSLFRRRRGRGLLFLGLLASCHVGAYADVPAPLHVAPHSVRMTACKGMVRADSTSFIRQFAKDDPRTQIIVSGPQAASIAKTLLDDITTHHDYKTRQGEDKIVILTLDQAEQAAQDPKFNDNTRIFLLATKELKGGLSATLARACPVDPSQLPAGSGTVTSRNLNSRAGHLAFAMAVVAPDAERLQTMLGAFAQPYADYKGMLTPISDKFETYRLAIFSSEADREVVEKWGRIDLNGDPKGGPKNVWTKYDWYPLSAYANLTPEQRDERHLIFFLNRGDTQQVVPEPAQALLKDQRLGNLTSVVMKGNGPNGLTCAVFSTPSDLLLQSRAGKYMRFDMIPDAPLIEDVTDLRAIDRSVFLVHGPRVKLTPDDAEAVRSETMQSMRKDLKVPVETLGAQFDGLQKSVVFQDLPGAIETAQRIREKSGVRYVWLFQVTEYGGKTSYMPSQKLVSPPPPPFALAHPEDKEPVEPTLDAFSGRGKKDQYEKDKAAWQPLHDAWLRRKTGYERAAETQYPCTWECKIEKESFANVQGVLRLIDLEHPNTPLWEKACKGRRGARAEFAGRTVQVRGTKNQPAPLPCPPNDDSCPTNLVQSAGIGAGAGGLFFLQASAFLPDGKPLHGQQQAQAPVKAPADPPLATVSGAKVAYVDDTSVTLKVDPGAEIKKGFWVDIPLSVIDIPDPDNPGKILSHKVVEKVIVRVVSLHDNVAECVPVSDKEKAKLKRVKTGMTISDSYTPPDPKDAP
ncbi:MAG: hypothetical protein JWN14_1336 [Chthonomonadales bacterium]|nr:hypothetical protein [Chthonomonadales bacterium]